MTNHRTIALTLCSLLILTGCGSTSLPAPGGNTSSRGAGDLEVSGFIEAEQIEVSAQIGGRVVELPYDEGESVAAGDLLVQIDPSLLEAQRDIAQAQLDFATAQRDLLEATPREEVIRQAQAQVAIAQAAVDAAEVAVADAAAIANNPQDLEVQVVDAQTQLAVASEQLVAAQVGFTSAERGLELYYYSLDQLEAARAQAGRYGLPEPGGLPLGMTLSPQRYQQATIELNAAQESVQGAQDVLAALQSFANDPAALRAQVAAAQAQLQTSRAALERAQAELEAMKAGAGPEDLAVADARIEQAQAAVDAVELQISLLAVTAPIDGIVLEQTVHAGELAAPGVPLVTLADLDVVELTVYVPEDRLNRVSLNQTVEITVDSFPDQTFTGTVVHISDEAEFTPRGVQTREERVNLVFAIEIRIENPEHALKPGMPADALFE